MTQISQKRVLGAATVQELREELAGEVVAPDEPGYDDARSVWNGAIDRRPALIARCASEADVVAALRFARSEGLDVAVRGGGHNVAGFGTCDGGLVIDLSPMKTIEIDADARTARAEAGLVWSEFDKHTQEAALATTGGLVSTTGVAGFTLGGGIGWLMRSHGLAADNLIGATVVTADGTVVRASADENPELLWGLRGGGGNFGIVTSFDFRLHPVGPMVYGGALFHPLDRAADVLRFYADWTRDLPDELTTMAVMLTAPPEPFIPVELQGTLMVAIACCYTGPQSEGEAAVAALRAFAPAVADVIGPIPYVALQGLFDHSAPRGTQTYWKTEYLADLGDGAVGVLVERAAAMADLFPMTMMHIHHLEGAVRRQPEGGSAFTHRDPRFVLNIIGTCLERSAFDQHIAWVRDTWSAIRPHSTGDPYLNFLGDEGQERVRAAYGEEAYARLVALKQTLDPENVFHLNQNIAPS